MEVGGVNTMSPSPARVFLALPTSNLQMQLGAAAAAFRHPVGDRELVESVAPESAASSLLAFCFNHLWCSALNQREAFTHFAMLHSDVEPEPFFLDVLVAEMRAVGADLLSVVTPIKTHHGLTSTAIDEEDDLYRPRRLTMAEIFALPETFSSKDLGGKPLLVNTGCWICRLDLPWIEELRFTVQDRIVRRDGKLVAETVSEDHFFSREFARQGGKVFATRKVKVSHYGLVPFVNFRAWGSWTTDQVAEARAAR